MSLTKEEREKLEKHWSEHIHDPRNSDIHSEDLAYKYLFLGAEALDRIRSESTWDDEKDQLRVQLAGCGVAAMCNTEESKKHRCERGDYGWSASYEDVCNAVDREISLRYKLDWAMGMLERADNYLATSEREHDIRNSDFDTIVKWRSDLKKWLKG